METSKAFDVLILGAGPAGTCAASILVNQGLSVAILERELFPRFSVGESLLPQSMIFLEEAGLLEAVDQAGFQPKDGAVFLAKGKFSIFNFVDKFASGPHQTYQVQRAKFDKVLADAAEKKGVKIFYQHIVTDVEFQPEVVVVKALDHSGAKAQANSAAKSTANSAVDADPIAKEFRCKFVLDASGFGRILPRLLGLDRKSSFPSRQALIGHFGVDFPESFDRNKILITVDEDQSDVWLWTIPFSDGTCSVGVVGTEEYFRSSICTNHREMLQAAIDNSPQLKQVLAGAKPINEVRSIVGYATDVSTLYGDRFALLGNAGEFLDPVFSSGVTIALHSASLAAALLIRQLKGEAVNWEVDFSEKLKFGVRTFKAFVSAWYSTELQSIIFFPKPEARIKSMICSILAGYAWDKKNPYAVNASRNLGTLAGICGDPLRETQ